MVNELIQGPIQLQGRGLARRPLGRYQTGEYSELTNAEVTTEGSIVPRQPVWMCGTGRLNELVPNAGNTFDIPIKSYKEGATLEGGANDSYVTGSTDPGIDFLTASTRFIGHYRGMVITAGLYGIMFSNSQDSIKPTYPAFSWNNFAFARQEAMDLIALGIDDRVVDNAFCYPIWMGEYRGKLYVVLSCNYSWALESPGNYDVAVLGELLVGYIDIDIEVSVTDFLTGLQLGDFTFSTIDEFQNFSGPGAGTPSILFTDEFDYYSQLDDYFLRKVPTGIKAFIHQDRLWLLTDRHIYWSVTADFTQWQGTYEAADIENEAGFISYDDEMTDAVPLMDSIYMVSRNRVYYLNGVSSLTSDPSSVSQLVISEDIGSTSCVEYEGSVFFVRGDALWSISGTNISKIMDLNLGIFDSPVGESFDDIEIPIRYFNKAKIHIKLGIKDNCLVIGFGYKFGLALPYIVENEEASGFFSNSYTKFFSKHTYFLNLDTGSIHLFKGNFGAGDLTDFMSIPGSFAFKGVSYSEYTQSSSQFYMLFSTNEIPETDWEDGYSEPEVIGSVVYGIPYYMDSNSTDNIADSRGCVDLVNIESYVPFKIKGAYYVDDDGYEDGDTYFRMYLRMFPICVEFPQYTPDGSKLFMKKFRSIVLEALAPKGNTDTPLILKVLTDPSAVGEEQQYDDINTFKGNTVERTVSGSQNDRLNLPDIYRFGLLLRLRDLSFRITNLDTESTVQTDSVWTYNNYKNSYWNITRATVLYSYTARASNKAND